MGTGFHLGLDAALNQWKAFKGAAPVASLSIFLFVFLLISDIVTKP